MTLVKDIVRAHPYEGDLGLELEVEGSGPLPRIRTKVWGTKGEGSLRLHGNEYYTTGETPIFNNADKREYIYRLTDKLQEAPVIKDSPRTSLHVHVNVQKLNIVHVYSLACSYWLFENLLTKFCGERLREGNYFCLRLQDAEQTIHILCSDLKRRRAFLDFIDNPGHEMRYSGINFASIPKFGSVEFRSMRGVIDPKVIDLWSSELHNLTLSSARFSPSQLMDKYFYATKNDFMHEFFSPEFCKMLQEFKHWEKLIEENEGAICELAYLEDWDKLEVKKPQFGFRPIPMDGEPNDPPDDDLALHELLEQMQDNDPQPAVEWNQVNLQAGAINAIDWGVAGGGGGDFVVMQDGGNNEGENQG